MSKRKKIFVLVGMVALLVVTGYLNILLNTTAAQASGGGDTADYGDFFDTYRYTRISTREQTILQLESIIQNETMSAASKAEAEDQLLALTASIEMELRLETLIKALGFEDAIVTNITDNINIIVKRAELTEVEAAKILEIVQTETKRDATNVRVIPVE